MPKQTCDADKELGNLIKLRRVELNMSQSELAENLGVTFQQIQKYEKGMNRISATRLVAIAKMLKVPVTFFYDCASDKNKDQQEVESLLGIDASFSIRLLRAYVAIKDKSIRHRLVALIESIADDAE